MADELDRMTTNLSGLIEKQTRSLQDQISTLSGSLEKFSDKLKATYQNTVGDSVSAAAPAPANAAAASAAGQVIMLGNDHSHPVPVFIVGQAGGDGQNKTIGLATGAAAAAGTFIGTLAGGFTSQFSGIATGMLLVAALNQAGPLLDKVNEILQGVSWISYQLLSGISMLLAQLFMALDQAGIFPVSKFVGTILVLIGQGLELIKGFVFPILQWANLLLVGMANWVTDTLRNLTAWAAGMLSSITVWISNFLWDLSVWLNDLVNSVSAFLPDFIDYLLRAKVGPALRVILQDHVRPALSDILDDLLVTVIKYAVIGITLAALTIPALIMEAGRWVGEYWVYALTLFVVDKLAPILSIAGITITPKLPSDPITNIGDAMANQAAKSREIGEKVAKSLMNEKPPSPSGQFGLVPDEPSPFFVRPLKPRTFHLRPHPSVSGDQAAQATAGAPAGAPAEAPAGAATTAQAGQPITVNGGIHVEIAAGSIDLKNADETARKIARQIMEELYRLTEVGRFRRGLPTEAIT